MPNILVEYGLTVTFATKHKAHVGHVVQIGRIRGIVSHVWRAGKSVGHIFPVNVAPLLDAAEIFILTRCKSREEAVDFHRVNTRLAVFVASHTTITHYPIRIVHRIARPRAIGIAPVHQEAVSVGITLIHANLDIISTTLVGEILIGLPGGNERLARIHKHLLLLCGVFGFRIAIVIRPGDGDGRCDGEYHISGSRDRAVAASGRSGRGVDRPCEADDGRQLLHIEHNAIAQRAVDANRPAVAGRRGSIRGGSEQVMGGDVAVGETVCAQGNARGDLYFSLIQRGPAGQGGVVVGNGEAAIIQHVFHTIREIPIRIVHYGADVPGAEILVEGFGIFEHTLHIRYVAYVPVADVAVELVSGGEHSAHAHHLAQVGRIGGVVGGQTAGVVEHVVHTFPLDIAPLLNADYPFTGIITKITLRKYPADSHGVHARLGIDVIRIMPALVFINLLLH